MVYIPVYTKPLRSEKTPEHTSFWYLSDMTRLIHMLILRAPALTHSCHFMVLSSSPLYLGSGTEGGLTATIWRKSIVIVPPAAVILANLTLSWIIMNNYYWWPFSQIPQLQHIDQTEPAWSKVAQRWVSSSQSNFLWSVCSLRDDPWCLGAGFGNCSLATITWIFGAQVCGWCLLVFFFNEDWAVHVTCYNWLHT